MVVQPLRSCVACRTSRPRRELVRVHLVAGGGLGLDLGGGSGRGAYVCPRRVCLEQAVKRGEFARCLKATVAPMTVEALEGLIREYATRKIVALLGLARRARKVASGAQAVESAMKRHSAKLILCAADASASSVMKLRGAAAAAGITWVQTLDKEGLGTALGTAPRACIAVTDSHFAGAMISVLEKIPVQMQEREAAWSGHDVGAERNLGRPGGDPAWA